MKNIHVLPTDKPSRLQLNVNTKRLILFNNIQSNNESVHLTAQNIYITSNEEIKEGDYAYHKTFGVGKITHIHGEDCFISIKRNSTDGTITTPWKRNIPDIKKIILTDNKDLIKDGVQAIDDEFLEWFCKNSSCERVEVIYEPKNFLDTKQGWEYEIIIPKEEPKQETIEEVVNNFKKTDVYINEIKQEQDKKFYSEEEVIDILVEFSAEMKNISNITKWFEQFKKK